MAHDEFDIVVVGAGAAGLAAAQLLGASGLSHLVLEARDRPGGRAWTVRLANGETADLGCGWLHSAETNPLAGVAERQGLTLDKSPAPWGRSSAQVGPNRAQAGAFIAALGRFRERVESRPADAADVACSALLEPGEPLNPLIDAVSTYYSGAELEKVSAADLQAYEDSGVNWRVREGLGAVVAGLAKGAPVRYSCPVRVLDRRGTRLCIETDLGTLSARAAIVTLPSNVIAASPDLFRPALPGKSEAASRLPLGLANKLYMELLAPGDFPSDSRAFGDMGRRATGGYQFRPLGRPLVEGYFGGDLAESLERDGLAGAFDFALGELVGLFGADFRRAVRPLAFHGWRSDPFAMGAYSYARPGGAGSRRTLAAAVDSRLFFAGEACSPDSYSTAHGAYLTGRAAAEAAMRALGENVG